MNYDLFRKEVFDSKQTKWTGSIILSRPFSFTILTTFSLFIAIIIILFSIWGNYTKRSTVNGQVVPISGLIQAYTTQPGIIIKKNIYEGQKVQQGETLYVISTTNYGEQGDIFAALTKQTQLKEQSLHNEIRRIKRIHQAEIQSSQNQISLLDESLVKINTLIENQKSKISLARNNLDRYQSALKQNATSFEEVENKKIEYFEQNAQYQSLQREKLTLEKQINEQKINLISLQNRQSNEIEQLERLVSTNAQEYIEMQSKQRIVIQANTSGIISSVNAEIGQFVDLSKPLLTILPEDTQLIAQLYVPSRAIGFVKEGDQVLLRYQAYPYQKFGHAKAQVLSVAKTALAGQDFKTIGVIFPQEQLNNEPVYLVRARLEKQTVKAYGNELPLQVGMTFEGDIMHETRKLYEWVLEPLFSITGKI
ncbi:hypothetical protein F889_00420 [Acinetobacter colistiniresistens]|uniref:AprE-like beta-barrel domain-containing protein n=1 Tax=Acinetobacter colistiniresistens TaxID=280145 RepID=N9PS27_9GAMM|nr:HlyD family efflux transporter periplasmic adaptor subunit [Acinetobacter colistiniresistens]ENX36258.1 hypothetical protein F889_00420 [Acinetobacter colistiniresistens]